MPRPSYLALLRAVPAFRDCPTRSLLRLSTLVDMVELPAGTLVGATDRELVVTVGPTSVLVVERRALDAVLDLAPDLVPADMQLSRDLGRTSIRSNRHCIVDVQRCNLDGSDGKTFDCSSVHSHIES